MLCHANEYLSVSALTGEIMETPPVYGPVTRESLLTEIGLVQEFFAARFEHTVNEQGELIEDDDLPPKQRFPKPRLPPTGKITSPRKRPIKEQQQFAKKKRKLEEGREEVLINGARPGTDDGTAGIGPDSGTSTQEAGMGVVLGSVKLEIPTSNPPMPDPEKEDEAPGMMSPPDSM
jgi:transcriptional activator SPT7